MPGSRGVLGWIENALMAVATVSVVLIMIIVTLDAIGRYAIGLTIYWSLDAISMYLMVFSLFFSLSYSFRHEDHMRMVSLRPLLPNRVLALGDALVYAACSAVFLFIAYRLFMKAAGHWAKIDVIIGAYLWPSWISPTLAGIGCLVFGATLAARAIGRLRDLASGAPDDLDASGDGA